VIPKFLFLEEDTEASENLPVSWKTVALHLHKKKLGLHLLGSEVVV
jgi:hypothetical protein